MCGIVGVAGTITFQHEKMFKGLLEVDTARGRHSTGIFTAARFNKVKPCEIEKHLGTPWDFYDMMGRNNLIPGTPKVVIGHNRAATLGKVTVENAHPFNFGNLYGVHNGTLRSWRDLDGAKDFEVDSQALYNHISKHGLQSALNNCYGAFALVWWDEEKQLLNFVRNTQRPLWFTFTKDNKTLFWASEEWMLLSQAERFDIEIGETYKFNPEVHCKLAIPAMNQPFEKFVTRKVEEKKPPVSTSGPYSGWPGYGSSRSHNHTQHQQRGNTGNIIPFDKSRGGDDLKQVQERMRSHIRKEVTFRLSGKVITGGKSYIHGCLTGDPKLTVRIYADKGEDLWKMCEVGQGLRFYGRVKRMNKREMYMLIDKRSVTPVAAKKFYDQVQRDFDKADEDAIQQWARENGIDDDKSLPNNYLPIDNGRLFVPEREWLRRTQTGCAWCTSPFHVDEADKLYWMQNGDVFCPECQKLQGVKEFMVN